MSGSRLLNEYVIQQTEVLVPRAEVANELVRREARARILAGARAAFARKGMAATMADVAASAGVSQGLPYRYFSDKEDLIRALVTDAVQQADARGSPPESPGGAAGRLRRLITTMAGARRAQPELFLLMQHVASDPAVPGELLELIVARGRAVTSTMRQLVTEAQAAGDAAMDDPDQLVTAVMACLDGLGRFTLAYPGQGAEHFPSAEVIIRILQLPPPQADPPGHDAQVVRQATDAERAAPLPGLTA
jgi:AcrR family transcriptional regulator